MVRTGAVNKIMYFQAKVKNICNDVFVIPYDALCTVPAEIITNGTVTWIEFDMCN